MLAMDEESMKEIFIWPGDCGLISLDPECIRMVTYMRFAGVPFEMTYQRNPYRYTEGMFPIFKDGEYVFTKFTTTVEHLRFKRYSLDFGLSARECSEMLALMAMAVRMLEPIVDYVFWANQRNYEEFTRPWFMKVMSPIFNMIHVRQRRKRAFALINAHYLHFEDSSMMESYLKTVAGECFSILSARLADNDYFYGSSPSSLDCTVYAYLAPLYKIPFPASDISLMLHNSPKLVQYVKRIDSKYFPELSEASRIVKAAAKSEEAHASMKLRLFTITFAVFAMLGYAISNKIITIPGRHLLLRES